MNRITRSLVCFFALFAWALFAAAASPARQLVPLEKVIAPDAQPAVSLVLAVCDHDAFGVALNVENVAVKYDVADQLAAPTALHQPKASGHARTCGHADHAAIERRNLLATYYDHRQ